MATGILRIQAFAARQSSPIEGVTVNVSGDGFPATRLTDAEGNAADVTLTTPACALSLDENNTTQAPYAVCSLVASKPGYRTVRIQGVQVFPGQVTLAQPEMIPDTEEIRDPLNAPIIIPPHSLFTGNGGSGPTPALACVPRVLDRVIIPKNITVHLGRPAASAQNVTVSFRRYIANVASSEVYPTWPEQALRANIHCQISLALNRIYTEWYPSKGYTFNITNSTSYDQYYVHGRTVFDVMVRLTDDIFNTYIRKTGTVNPYYAEYCDGKSVTCPGLKQWGTVTLANQGRNALSILKYYYGNNIEIVRTNNIQSIPRSYPGSPLRQGSTGSAVFTLQRQLNRITKDYPFLGLLTVDGIFGSRMTATVKKFQKQFGLTADGVVGRSTWYKISYIYVSVKDLAELTSEGETSNGTLSNGTWDPGSAPLKVGSTGREVEQLQFWLSTLAQYESRIPSVTVDGIFGSGTAAAVRAFQRRYGLTADGIVGRATWTELYNQFRSIQSDNGTPNAYPGTALRQGSSGQNVRLVQFWLKIARTVYQSLSNVTVDGIFGPATTAAVRRRGPHDVEQALRGLQRHRQPPALVQPAARRISGPAAQRLHRHSGAGAAVLPLSHERLPEQHPLRLHRWPFRRGHRGRRPGLPAVRRADGGRHRGPENMGFALRKSLGSPLLRACGHPQAPALSWHAADHRQRQQRRALLRPAFAAHRLLLRQRGVPRAFQPIHPGNGRRHRQCTGASGPARHRRSRRRDVDGGGGSELTAGGLYAQP